MQFYMAPMEGLTGYVFRNAHARFFGKLDKYFTPFIAGSGLSHRELHDVLPEHNRDLPVVPQIMTNRAADFLAVAKRLEEFGYREVNLNLGCPSGTVVSKGRGAGFLKDPEALERFFEAIYDACPLRISVKTRIGVSDAEEWERIRAIYARFPVEELIIHPRLQKDFYKGPIRWDAFARAVSCFNDNRDCNGFKGCDDFKKTPLCYNGDVHSVAAYRQLREQYPQVDRVMLGRGILMDPFLVQHCQSGESDYALERLRDMLQTLLQEYRREMGNDTHTLYKMKEIWTYLGLRIADNGTKALKKIKKARTLEEYRIGAAEALRAWEETCAE
ncbi:MAG: tRNA-dihydrouridine synthase family protein [Lachnospiraceae bacterium]|nr:tRNA-dihydrouridine synthase family protein [Lachnospiraceae bacterium]